MCGIVGGVVENIDLQSLSRSLDAIRHRGPDDSGTFCQGNAFMGMRRLSIIDLAGGQQPIFNEDRSLAVIFNGEIYNYKELVPDLEVRGHRFQTVSDTETLVHLYEDHGVEMCQHLRGMFAFILWDTQRQRLYAARDRFGKKPLYYALSVDGLLIASELKALRVLMKSRGLDLTINEQAIYDYLSLGCVPQPETIYQNVYSLPPGSWLTFDGNRLHIQEYWHLDFKPDLEISYPEALEQARGLVGEAVRLRTRSDVPIGVLLSGGIDSSIVAYEAARHVGAGLQTFTVATSSPELDESSTAARTARALGVQNTILPLKVSPLEELEQLVRQYDQPYADSSAIPSLAISRLARQHVTVALNGDGGDEVFSGYRRYLAADRSGQFDWLPSPIPKAAAGILQALNGHRRSRSGFASRFLRGLALPPPARYIAWTTDLLLEDDKHIIWQGNSMRPTETWLDSVMPQGLSSLDKQVCTDMRVNLLSDLLVKMDIATMAASLEGRSPMLDHHVAEFAAKLPAYFRLAKGRTKAILRDAYRGLLPDEVINGIKRGFEVPMKTWLEGELRPLLMDTVGDAQARVKTYLRSEFVDALLAGRVLRERNQPSLLYSVLLLELWLREFL